MRLVGSVTILLILLVSCLPACSPSAPSGDQADGGQGVSEAKYQWRFGSSWTDATRHMYCDAFCTLVNDYSEGQIEIEFLPDGVLGPHDETFHAVQEGSVELGLFAPFVHIVPGGMLNWMPWTIGSYEEAALAFDPEDGILFQVMDEAWREVGCKMLWTTTCGAYGLANDVREIRTPDDLENIKFRVSGSVGFVKTLQNMGEGTGMTVETIPWADTYNAIERGVVDGLWNLWNLMVENRFTEVCDYYTALDWGWDANGVVINRDVWEGLSPELQAAVMKAGRIAETGEYEAIQRMETYFKKTVEDAGVQVYYPSPEEKAVFREKARMPEIWAELCTPWLDEHYPGQDMTTEMLLTLDSYREQCQTS